MSIPEELARREKRLAAIATAKSTIEARAKERHAREQAGHDAKMAQRAAKTAVTGKEPGGRPPAPPVEGPLPTDQVNLTDERSRIMPVAGGGFEQCYNAQAVVAVGSLLVIAADVIQAPNDKGSIQNRGVVVSGRQPAHQLTLVVRARNPTRPCQHPTILHAPIGNLGGSGRIKARQFKLEQGTVRQQTTGPALFTQQGESCRAGHQNGQEPVP